MYELIKTYANQIPGVLRARPIGLARNVVSDCRSVRVRPGPWKRSPAPVVPCDTCGAPEKKRKRWRGPSL
jgi:hypothetical protein